MQKGGGFIRRLRLKKRGRISFIPFFLFSLLLLGIFYTVTLSPAFTMLAESGCKNHAESIMYRAILSVSEGENFSDLTEVKEYNGKITGITINPEKANKIRSLFASKVNELLSGSEYQTFSIPSGNLTGITLLSGRGFKIPLIIVPMGGVDADIYSDISDAGINHTKHSVYIKAKATVKLMHPLGSIVSVSETTIPLSETVIAGDVPNVFLQGENTKEKG